MTSSFQILNLTGISAEQLYADTQCNMHSIDGAVLITDFGLIIMVQAWPVSVNVSEADQEITGIHRLSKHTDWETYQAGRYADAYQAALNLINSLGDN
jgi:hypothetical protein